MRKLLFTSRSLFDILCFLNVLKVVTLVCWMNPYTGSPAPSSAEESIESESTLHSSTRPKDWDDWDSRACWYEHDMSSSYLKCSLNYEAWILMGHEFMEMKNTPAAACLEVE